MEEGSAADDLVTRYRVQLQSGDAAAAGGSTDPAVRLDNLLRVRIVCATLGASPCSPNRLHVVCSSLLNARMLNFTRPWQLATT